MKELLIQLKACKEAKEWAGDKTWPEIYKTCHRGDWLLWLFFNTMNHNNEEHFTLLTHAKGHCANTVRHLMEDQRSIDAVEAAINYSGDKEVLKNAASAAYASASAADASASAAYAASASAAYASASAAYASAYAASASAAYAAKTKNQLLTANIVRQYIPIEKWNINL